MDAFIELSNAFDLGKPWDGPMTPELPRYVCHKRPYQSIHEATHTIRHAMERGRNRPKFLRSYHCPDCGQWHLTSKQ